MTKYLSLLALVALFSSNAFANKITDTDGGKITKKVTLAHAQKALKLVTEKGDKSFDELSDEKGDWVTNDLYAFVIDYTGNVLAHVYLKGKNIMELKDKDGKAFVSEFVNIAKNGSGEGWSRYYWPRPGTKTPALKYAYIMKVPAKNYFVGVGTYDMTDSDMK